MANGITFLRSGFAVKAAVFAALALGMGVVARSQFVASSEMLAVAVAIDMVVTLPVVYFLLIRTPSVPKITVIAVFFVCTLAASMLLPENETGFLDAVVTYAIPAAEIGVLGYLGFRVYRTRSAFLAERAAGRDMIERLRRAFVREIKPAAIARAAAFEIGTFLIATLGQRRPEGVAVTYHKRNSPRMLLGVFGGVLAVETAVVHILLAMWTPIAAWVATAGSAYLLIQMVAHFRALSCRPITLTEESLFIRCGILGDVEAGLDLIESVEPIGPMQDATGEVFELSPLGPFTQPNVLITFTHPVEVNRPYGLVSKAEKIRLAVDEPEAFSSMLTEK